MASFGSGSLANTTAAIDSSTPWVAAADGNLPLLQTSLQQLQLSVSAADTAQGYTLLMAAASYSQLHVLDYLLANQVELNAVDHDGDSALHYASTHEAAAKLVAAGVDRSRTNATHLTALQAKQAEYEEMKQDPDFDHEDIDSIQLKGTIDYLLTLG